jgi:hypothetical protein
MATTSPSAAFVPVKPVFATAERPDRSRAQAGHRAPEWVTISLITDCALRMCAVASPMVSGPASARCSSTALEAPGRALRGRPRRWNVR